MNNQIFKPLKTPTNTVYFISVKTVGKALWQNIALGERTTDQMTFDIMGGLLNLQYKTTNPETRFK